MYLERFCSLKRKLQPLKNVKKGGLLITATFIAYVTVYISD